MARRRSSSSRAVRGSGKSRPTNTARQRSAAARKGWETRRHNARAAASRKGWETRRAEHTKRSTAAKKGWETRRAVDFMLSREKDTRGKSAPAGGAAAVPAESAPRAFDNLSSWLEYFDDYDGDYDEIDVEITPSYGED